MNYTADLLIIDPQNDFCDSRGSLFVPGSEEDVNRLNVMIKRVGDRLNDIHITLDTHHNLDVAHPLFWLDAQQNHPAPFTLISVDDVKNGVWRTSIHAFQERALAYVEALEKNNRYQLLIWPPHCLIGSWGTQVVPNLWNIVSDWEKQHVAFVDYVTKGSNLFTEHYSAVKADVPDPNDPSTQLNIPLVETLKNVDIIGIAGEALSHCVKFTTKDIADNFGDENIKKMVLLEDCTSSVTGFEQQGLDFIDEMKSRGMQVMKSTDFLA